MGKSEPQVGGGKAIEKKCSGGRVKGLHLVQIFVLLIKPIIRLQEDQMTTLTANELKTKGAKSLEEALKDSEEVSITVRGKDRFVVMDIERYNYLRECELEAALAESLSDLEKGDFVEESVDEHIERMENEL